MNRSGVLLTCLLSLTVPGASAALDPTQPLSAAPPYSLFAQWAKPVNPFRIHDNLWYVGTDNLSSLLITTPQGHILIDAALDVSAPRIRQNIEALGFRLSDVRLILNSHARLDQAGGIARLKAWSGATLVASQANADQMTRGGKGDFALGDALPFPAVDTDKVIQDGEILTIGRVRVEALLTPGHLPGSTSWLITLPDGKTLIYADSLATPDYYLVNNKNYPSLVSDIRKSFALLTAQKADIFIASKGDRFDLKAKRARLDAGDKDAFIDRDGLQRYVLQSQRKFEQSLAKQFQP